MPVDPVRMEEEAVAIARDLIRIETVNTGDPATIGDGEERAARYVRERLAEEGIEGELVLAAPGRGSVVARIPGRDRSAPALLAHAHLDVVPVDAAAWSVPPFAAEVREDARHGEVLYGRGAVDMKGFAGTLVAVARAVARSGVAPRRDLVLAFLADEEAGGVWGAQWLVEHRPDLFAGVTESIGEVGGFSVPLGPRRAYLLATAEKGSGRAFLRAHGTAGHASRAGGDNAVLRLARAVAAVGGHRFPLRRTAAVDAFLAAYAETTGQDLTDHADLDGALAGLGLLGDVVAAGLRDTATPTVLTAGHKVNVVPGEATAEIDTRTLPGDEQDFWRELERLAGDDATLERAESTPALAAPGDGPLVATLRAAVAAEDPGGVVLPYLLPASTDTKNFARLGIAGYGFTPLRVPADVDVFGLFHAVDERVPLSALRFCARTTERILRTA